jgi:two-component system nitrate/nitrite sensor histidine kinase NarX
VLAAAPKNPSASTNPGVDGRDASRARIDEVLSAAHLKGPLVLFGVGLLVSLGTWAWLAVGGGGPEAALVALLAGLAAVVGGALALAARLHRGLLRPLVTLEQSVAQLCQGESTTRPTLEEAGILGELVRNIESLREELAGLYEDMDNRVARQTMRLAQKTASLNILYDVAAGINQIQELDELLLRFLRVLKEMVNGRAATVRLATPEGAQRLVGAIGLDDRLLREEEMRPLDLCLCGTALSPGDILCDHPDRHCERAFGRRMFASDEIEVVRVPLGYQDQVLGAYSLFVQKPGVSEREDILELLATIGHHLGMAVAKQRSDQEAKRLSILQERNALAHELHDSLAQTLASLRFQVRLLDESLREGPLSDAARRDLQRIQTGLDQAHTELRDLLSSFRAPIDQRGLVLALEQLVRRFGQDTGLHVLLQNDCRQIPLAAATEMQLLRVVQEALTNVRKHAQAHTVRVLLTCRSGGALLLLVEDDGVGFRAPVSAGRPGERLGLSIMQERARRMGAELRIESEPGEGTRVELTLETRPRSAPLAQRLVG